MRKIKGIAVSAGVAFGRVRILTRKKIVIKNKAIVKEQIETELIRFSTSVEEMVNELDQLICNLSENDESAAILSTQKMILEDPEFTSNIKQLIEKDLMSLEQAVHQHFTAVMDLFKSMKNDYFAERSSDYEDIAHRFLYHIMPGEVDVLADLEEDSIIVSGNITPSGVTKLYEKNIQGIVTEKGSNNSHSSIIARSMNLPYVARINGLLDLVKNGELIIVDGLAGEIILDPDKETRDKFQKILDQRKQEREELNKLIGVECVSRDGKKIGLMSNIEIPDEISIVNEIASTGIGLFRTEFLFIDRDELPDEEEQYLIYRKIAEAIYPHPLVIRTIDVGGDKLSKVLNLENEENPNLGCRGIRISLQNKPVFRTQIKAILRAGKDLNIKIMFPMISSQGELIQVEKIIEECKADLRNKNCGFDGNIKIGAMIEIPSAAITSDCIASESDFLSIGTNDLIQYTLAADRDNQTVDEYYIPHHPSVLRLIKLTIKNAHEQNIKVAVCGEMASQIKFVPLLLGMGIDELSVSPGQYLKIKKLILDLDISALEPLADKILQISDHYEISKAIDDMELVSE